MEKSINTVIDELNIIAAEHPLATDDIRKQVEVLKSMIEEQTDAEAQTSVDGQKILEAMGGKGVFVVVVPVPEDATKSRSILGVSLNPVITPMYIDNLWEGAKKMAETFAQKHPQIALLYTLSHLEDLKKEREEEL